MILESINICMDQKKIFIANLLQYTQQMDQACLNDDLNSLIDLFKLRADYMRRIDKCDAMIKKQAEELSEAEQVKLNSILADPLIDQQYQDEFNLIRISQIEYNDILKKVVVINQNVLESLKNSHTEILNTINDRPRKISQQKSNF